MELPLYLFLQSIQKKTRGPCFCDDINCKLQAKSHWLKLDRYFPPTMANSGLHMNNANLTAGHKLLGSSMETLDWSNDKIIF